VSSKVRTRLIESALNLFSQWGYEAVGVQQIVAMAKVTKPSLYHYFGSKRGLIEALFQETTQELLNELRLLEAAAVPSLPSVEPLVEAYFGFVRRNPAFYRLQLALYFAPLKSEGYKAAGKYYVIQREEVVRVLKNLLSGEEMSPVQLEWQATLLIGLINCCASAFLNGEIKLTAKVTEDTSDQFLFGTTSQNK
jgi:AcrR family transcriptional regulator